MGCDSRDTRLRVIYKGRGLLRDNKKGEMSVSWTPSLRFRGRVLGCRPDRRRFWGHDRVDGKTEGDPGSSLSTTETSVIPFLFLSKELSNPEGCVAGCLECSDFRHSVRLTLTRASGVLPRSVCRVVVLSR